LRKEDALDREKWSTANHVRKEVNPATLTVQNRIKSELQLSLLPVFPLRSATAQYHQTIYAVKSNYRALVTFKIQYRVYIA